MSPPRCAGTRPRGGDLVQRTLASAAPASAGGGSRPASPSPSFHTLRAPLKPAARSKCKTSPAARGVAALVPADVPPGRARARPPRPTASRGHGCICGGWTRSPASPPPRLGMEVRGSRAGAAAPWPTAGHGVAGLGPASPETTAPRTPSGPAAALPRPSTRLCTFQISHDGRTAPPSERQRGGRRPPPAAVARKGPDCFLPEEPNTPRNLYNRGFHSRCQTSGDREPRSLGGGDRRGECPSAGRRPGGAWGHPD